MAANAYDDEVWDAFCNVIAEEDRDGILTMMAEAAHADKYENETVQILKRTRHNVINVTVSGIVTYKGKEYTFHLEDGDWAGTQLRGWQDTGTDYEEPEYDPLDVQPKRELINKAVMPGGNPKFLVQKWDIFRTRSDVMEALRSYAYDTYFQPGCVIRDHYKEKFDRWGLEVVRKSTADETRKMLVGAE